MKNLRIIIATILTAMLFASCKNDTPNSNAEETEHHDEHENGNTVTLSAEQIKSIKIEYGAIEKKQLTSSLKANGILKVPNQNRATATSFMGGIVKSILVQPGNTVRKGQIIATIANTSFITMQEEFLTISYQMTLAELEYKRQRELQEGNAGALKVFQQVESDFKTLKARKSSLQKQLELIGINVANLSSENIQTTLNILSPISGSVSSVLANVGSFVDANNPIAEIIDNSQLHLDLFVYEKDLAKIKVGQTIHFTLTNNAGREYDADVFAISNTFEQNTKAVSVHATVKGNKEGLIDGMSITALVSLDNATVDAVPTSAIVNHEGQDYIFIVTDPHEETEHHEHGEDEAGEHKHDEHGHEHDEGKREEGEHEHDEEGVTYEKIPVSKGTTAVGYSEITLLKEIPKESKIVINGAFFILGKMNNKGEGHSH